MFSRTLVAVDGSENSKHALDIAAREVSQVGGELIILTVIPPVHVPKFDTPGSGMVAPFVRDYKEKIQEEYAYFLRISEYETKEKYPEAKVTSVLIQGQPVSVICGEAEKRDVSSIVVGSRGIHGVEGWVLGSTSRRIVEQSKKPVIVIKL